MKHQKKRIATFTEAQLKKLWSLRDRLDFLDLSQEEMDSEGFRKLIEEFVDFGRFDFHFLIDRSEDFNRDKINKTDKNALNQALRDATSHKDCNAVSYLISQNADVNACSEYGSTPLHAAIEMRGFEVAQLLLKNHANPNCQESTWNQTPLHYAASHGDARLVKLLMEYGAKTDMVETFYRKTPIDMASCGLLRDAMASNAPEKWQLALEKQKKDRQEIKQEIKKELINIKEQVLQQFANKTAEWDCLKKIFSPEKYHETILIELGKLFLDNFPSLNPQHFYKESLKELGVMFIASMFSQNNNKGEESFVSDFEFSDNLRQDILRSHDLFSEGKLVKNHSSFFNVLPDEKIDFSKIKNVIVGKLVPEPHQYMEYKFSLFSILGELINTLDAASSEHFKFHFEIFSFPPDNDAIAQFIISLNQLNDKLLTQALILTKLNNIMQANSQSSERLTLPNKKLVVIDTKITYQDFADQNERVQFYLEVVIENVLKMTPHLDPDSIEEVKSKTIDKCFNNGLLDESQYQLAKRLFLVDESSSLRMESLSLS